MNMDSVLCPSNFSANVVNELMEKAIDWAFAHGLCIRSRKNFTKNSIQFFPFILLPSPFPRREFDNARRIQTTLNVLIHRVAQDHDFLSDTLKETIRVDDFTRRLFEIYETVRSEGGSAQKVSLGILRSDLMLDTCCTREDADADKYLPYCCCKQVEINTIASGCGGVGPLTRELHRYVLREIGREEDLENLPENDALREICSSIIDAWKMYGNEQGVVLFVVEDVTYNICDQRLHEFEIRRQNPDVRVVRRSLTQLSATARLGSRRELTIDDDYVVSVVYYRSGYEPGQYPTEKEWETRLLIERSSAIKCPTIQYHLAGTKKVQQVLAKPGVVCKFLDNEQTCAEIKKIFTGLYALDFDEQGEAATEMGIADPDEFVLKPQREGGSNNKYGSDVKHFLESVRNQTERVAWILMDKIHPPVHDGYMIRPEDHANGELQELVSELGVFGVILADDENVYINKQTGHMLRTKLATANEGGVSTGLAVPEVIHAVAKYEVEREPREIFFFEEGTVVMWNVSELECENILDFLKKYEQNRYMDYIVQSESEQMRYSYTADGKQSHLRSGIIMIASNATSLDKYTFSNAMAQSVKLGVWEASLDNYVDSIEFVTEDLKAGRKLQMTQQEVLRKQGELFKLRHSINLSSDLLDTPDFYWERDDLERVYQETCSYFNIAKRTRVINEKLNHCVELVAILSTHLSDRHHIRLEWMIIILIMVEVAFEMLHYVDKYFS